MEKIVYFVRHGQSLGNAAAIFQPPESPLSDIGRKQAVSIGERVSRLPVQTLISSPFQRAKETAAAIADATGLEPQFCDLFVERIKPSSINGKPYDDEEAYSIWRQWNQSLYTPGMRVADGENFDDLILRADRALAYLERRDERGIAVVTHGYFLRTIVARAVLGDMLSGEAFLRFQRIAAMENTALTVMHYHGAIEDEPGWHVWSYNDHAHLG